MNKKLVIIISKGTLDTAYTAFVLAVTGASLGMEIKLFFTFYGLDLIHKKKFKKLRITSLANPAFPFKIPQAFWTFPFMTFFQTKIMEYQIKRKGLPSFRELLEESLALKVKFFPCEMSMRLLGYKKEDFIEGVEDPVGAATFLSFAEEADITLFI